MDEQYRQRLEEIAREMIRSGEFDYPVNPDRDARLDRNNQDDWSLILLEIYPHLMARGILYHIHI